MARLGATGDEAGDEVSAPAAPLRVAIWLARIITRSLGDGADAICGDFFAGFRGICLALVALAADAASLATPRRYCRAAHFSYARQARRRRFASIFRQVFHD